MHANDVHLQLKYKYHYLENEEEIVRTVSVVDSTPPELTFEGEIKYCKNAAYIVFYYHYDTSRAILKKH